ncbi:hypothetical protein [Okeania hirsuta]
MIFELCTEHNWRLIALEIMPDHVHLEHQLHAFLEKEHLLSLSMLVL